MNGATLLVEELGGRADFLVAVRYFNPCTSSSNIPIYVPIKSLCNECHM